MAQSLSGKICLVTGASSGIGAAVSIMFAERGASVTLCGRDPDRLKASMDQCVKVSGGHTDRFLTVVGDITQQEVRKQMVEATVGKFGRLDVLVCNAGVFPPNGNVLSASEETFDLIINTNLKAVAFLIQLAVPHLEKTKGNIVSVSALASTLAFTPDNIYAISKAALDHMTRCLVLDLGPKGIRINCVNPGYVPTRILREKGDSAGEITELIEKVEGAKHPLHGRCVRLEELAEAVTFLASDAASFITGECLKVDGGRFSLGGVRPN